MGTSHHKNIYNCMADKFDVLFSLLKESLKIIFKKTQRILNAALHLLNIYTPSSEHAYCIKQSNI